MGVGRQDAWTLENNGRFSLAQAAMPQRKAPGSSFSHSAPRCALGNNPFLTLLTRRCAISIFHPPNHSDWFNNRRVSKFYPIRGSWGDFRWKYRKMEAYCLAFTWREEPAQMGECSGISRTLLFLRVKRGYSLHLQNYGGGLMR